MTGRTVGQSGAPGNPKTAAHDGACLEMRPSLFVELSEEEAEAAVDVLAELLAARAEAAGETMFCGP